MQIQRCPPPPLLAPRCPCAGGMREQEMREIKLHGVTKLGLKNIIDFIYTSKVSLDMGNLQDTLEAANFLQVMPVLKFCNELLSNEVRPLFPFSVFNGFPPSDIAGAHY